MIQIRRKNLPRMERYEENKKKIVMSSDKRQANFSIDYNER